MTTRRDFLRKSTLAASLGPGAVDLFHHAHSPFKTALDDLIIGHNGFQYKVDKGWAKISVNSTPVFNCHEMVQDSKGRLIMLGDNVR
ncbi:twin-arginine translocation signal domain-containing protein, partial [Arsenicibacter rosenii]|uniref:twin-arginine translocation signal domain-containing protein n=1 Tax=Arsenicibacter rosenii TaxID=1750698 RepID=UPI0011603B87